MTGAFDNRRRFFGRDVIVFYYYTREDSFYFMKDSRVAKEESSIKMDVDVRVLFGLF